jgi:hypothetical protein
MGEVGMERIDYIIVREVDNCKDCCAVEIDKMHRRQGWLKIGYHFVVTTEGELETGRALGFPGAHARGFNNCSIGIALCGSDHSDEQLSSLFTLVLGLLLQYPDAEIINHPLLRDNDDDDKGFNAEVWWTNLILTVP